MADRFVSSLVSQHAENQFPTEPSWSSGMTYIFLLSGTADIQVNTHQYRLRPFDFLFFKPYDIYYATHPGQVYTAFVITLERTLLVNVCPQLDNLSFDLRLIRYSQSDAAYQYVCRNLAKVTYAFMKPDACSELKTVSAVSNILTMLIETYGSEAQESRPGTDYARERSVSILRYISEHYSDNISLADIAGHVGLHPQYFSAFFKKNFNANFSDYLNRYRVSQSLQALINTEENILSIAVANGFNNHKTYSSAFQKAYGMLPREYRKLSRNSDAQYVESNGSADSIGFRFFQQYWESDDSSQSHTENVKSHQIIRHIHGTSPAFTNGMKNFITVGRAVSCLRSDVQQQLRQAKQDLKLDYARIQDIFSDDLFLYYEDDDKNPNFNWISVDTVFDFFQSIGIRPYIELGFMPAPLASKKQYAAWQYHPNISAPKSYSAWTFLVTKFLEHCIERYGSEEIRLWYFDFWTTPNLKLDQNYWNESQGEFFRFYQVTYEAVRKVDPLIPFGTPNFSYPSGMSWYEAFFAYANKHKLHPDFISHHAYNISDGQNEGMHHIPRYGEEDSGPKLVPQRDYLLEQLEEIDRCSRHMGFGDLDIIISDWNLSYLLLDYTRDTSFMAAFFAYSYASVLGRVKGVCVWSLSDIHEEFFYKESLFHGGPGLVDYLGTPKASYHAVAFSYGLSKEILQHGNNFILAKDGYGYQLLLFNMSFYDQGYLVPDLSSLTYSQRYNVYEAARTLSFHMIFSVPAGEYTITHRRINRESGSSYDLWLKIGKPNDMRGGLYEHLKARCIPDIYVESEIAAPELVFDAQVEPHGVTLITIQPSGHKSRF